MRRVKHVALEYKATLGTKHCKVFVFCTWLLVYTFSISQNINQLEIFGDMSTPPDITSPSVSSCRTYAVCDLHLIKSWQHFQWAFSLCCSFLTPTPPRHRPPPLRQTRSTSRRACSLPRSCLLLSVQRLCPQVRPRSASAYIHHCWRRGGNKHSRGECESNDEMKGGGLATQKIFEA